ncbi:DUF2314 domain-containing protein [Rhizomonospora bruguierae]|uniref:DUF2314 domain-containing protein n=1 Tax=Rhizomonospora bruguierae TaxID=1581705 RepID=UPI001BCE54B2|nr:DUF2314 domain-containing protein [Micromonospora sp. NBRC 107566]
MSDADEALILSVPEVLTATYLVPTATPPDEPAGAAGRIVDGLLAGPVRDLALQMLAGPLMSVQTRPADDLPAVPLELLAAFGATDDQLATIRSATHFVEVTAGFRPGWPPAHEWAARATATALAHLLDSVVIDVFAPQVLSVAAATRSLPDSEGRFRLVDWLLVPYSTADTGLWFTTKGMGRFGLLELQTVGVPPQFARAWGATLTGVARRLLRTWGDRLDEPETPAFVEVPDLVTVTGHDVAVAYADPANADAGAEATGAATVRLTVDPATDPDADSFLTLTPPGGHTGSAGEFFAAVCASLFGATERDVRYARPTDALATAIATAREGLAKARDRFLSDELPRGAHLLVKYGLPAGGDGHEYVWAYVTSWSDPTRVLGASANDADTDPGVRVGRPVVVDAAEIVDWAVWIDGRGIVEGGWTNEAVTGG